MINKKQPHRLAVDIGGTFVDAVLLDVITGKWRLEKSFTTPKNAANGVNNAIQKLGIKGGELDAFIHGTTLGLNTVLERRGAITGILTNIGFEDILEMGRYKRERSQMYSLEYDIASPLVPKRRRLGVPGRINAQGEELIPLDESAVLSAVEKLVKEGKIEAIGVCFLHAYKNPVHERQTAKIIKQNWPNIAISLSSDIVREYREYERTSTTAVNAYIQPIFRSYIGALEEELKNQGFDSSFYITRSGGGALPAKEAADIPVHTIFSGPAGGLIGAAHLSELLDCPDIISVDIGGTSTDACVVKDRAPALKYESTLERLPLMIPTYDISTIGAGGGSIAKVENGLLKVGPQSSGATPGPICYGRDGKKPTFTDAAVVLGYIDPFHFLGGEIQLDKNAAIKGITEQISRPLGLDVTEAARGIFDVVLGRTVSAIREITVEQGLDPREFSMLGFGGAGPVFVPLVGREMGVRNIIIPQAPSAFSAWGMLMTDSIREYSRTLVGLLSDVGISPLHKAAMEMAEQANIDLEGNGFTNKKRTIESEVALRYFGQEHALEVALHEEDTIDTLSKRYDGVHRERYGHTMADPVQLVHLRVRGIGHNPRPELEIIAKRKKGNLNSLGVRKAFCFASRKTIDFVIYSRDDLRSDDRIIGPAVIEEETTTVIIHSDQNAVVDRHGHIFIGIGGRK